MDDSPLFKEPNMHKQRRLQIFLEWIALKERHFPPMTSRPPGETPQRAGSRAGRAPSFILSPSSFPSTFSPLGLRRRNRGVVYPFLTPGQLKKA